MANLYTTSITVGGKIGGFTPSALYSFEFRERNNPTNKTEIFLLLPPESYSMEYGYRTTIHKTIGGTSFDWFGTDNPQINLSGSLWSYWIDMLPAPFGNKILGNQAPAALNDFTSSAVNKLANAASKLVSGFFPLNQMSGLEEFFRIKYMLYDFFSPITGKLIPTSVNTLGRPLKGLEWMKRIVELQLNDLSYIELIYHDYDDDIHWEVVPQPMRIRREKRDSFTAFWEINLIGIRDIRTKPFRVPAQSKKFNPDEVMAEVADALLNVNLAEMLRFTALEEVEIVKDLEKLSFDGFFAEYEKALEEYFQGKKDNIAEVKYQSDIFSLTVDAAVLEVIKILTGLELGDYITDSLSSTPSEDTIASGKDEAFSIFAESLLLSIALLGMDAYIGNKIAVIEGKSGKTVDDLAPITDETFGVTESEAGSIKYVEEQWLVYIVKKNDNLGKIAVQQLGDYNRFPEIAKLNNLIFSDFLLDNMVGEIIKLPERKQTNYNSPNNLVYKPNRPKNVNNQILQEELIGRDIKLNIDRSFNIDNSGDLRITLPLDGFVANVLDSLSFPNGTLPLYPEWGLDIGDIGDVSSESEKAIVQSKIITAAEKDPRVISAIVDRNTIRREGDRIYYEVSTNPLIGGELTIGGN